MVLVEPRRTVCLRWFARLWCLAALGLGCSGPARPASDAVTLCRILELGLSRWIVAPGERCHLDDPIGELELPGLCEPGADFLEALTNALDSGSLQVDLGRIAECRAAAEESFDPLETTRDLEAVHWGMAEMLAAEPRCAALFVGTLGAGEPCVFGVECQEGLRCELDLEALEERCLPPAAIGEACDDETSRNCADGLACIDRRCATPLAVGAVCDPEEDGCAEGLECRGDRCAQLPGQGEPCDDGDCADGAYCTDSGLCELEVGSGSPCEGASACAATCEVCRPDGASDLRRCQPRGEDGEPCLDHDHCRRGLRCDDGVCQPSLSLGSSCTDDEECDTRVAFCDYQTGQCRERGGPGAECSGYYLSCAEPYYCADGACRVGENGDPCESFPDCESHFCRGEDTLVDGVCEPSPSDGDPCERPDDCGHDQACRDGECVTLGWTGELCTNGDECRAGECVQPQGRCGVVQPEITGCNVDIAYDNDLFTEWVVFAGILAATFIRRRRKHQ